MEREREQYKWGGGIRSASRWGVGDWLESVDIGGKSDDQEVWTRGELFDYLDTAVLTQGSTLVLVFDLDRTLRDQKKLGNLVRLRVGQFTKKDMDYLDRLEEYMSQGVRVLVVTNQVERGHQVARYLGKWRGYPAFPEELQRRKVAFIGGEAPVRFLIPFKLRKASVERAVGWLDWRDKGVGRIAFIGDKQTDLKWALRVEEALRAEGYGGEIELVRVKI